VQCVRQSTYWLPLQITNSVTKETFLWGFKGVTFYWVKPERGISVLLSPASFFQHVNASIGSHTCSLTNQFSSRFVNALPSVSRYAGRWENSILYNSSVGFRRPQFGMQG
jgi:hypothetical protein